MSDLLKKLRESNDYYAEDAADYIEVVERELAECKAENAALRDANNSFASNELCRGGDDPLSCTNAPCTCVNYLKAENAALQDDRAEANEACLREITRADKAEAENAALRKDAERYRKLRAVGFAIYRPMGRVIKLIDAHADKEVDAL